MATASTGAIMGNRAGAAACSVPADASGLRLRAVVRRELVRSRAVPRDVERRVAARRVGQDRVARGRRPVGRLLDEDAARGTAGRGALLVAQDLVEADERVVGAREADPDSLRRRLALVGIDGARLVVLTHAVDVSI